MEKSKIAIIEDDPFIGKYLQIILKKKGFSCYTPATTSSDAIDLLQKEKPDLAIVDFNLASGDLGSSIARLIHSKYPHLPFIVFSSYDEDHLVKLFNGIFPDAILCKPSTPDQIDLSLIFSLYKRKLMADLLVSKENADETQEEKNIVYIQEQNETSIVKTRNSFEKSTNNLDQIEAKLSTSYFYRINATTLVNLIHIQTISPSIVYIKDQFFTFSQEHKIQFDLKIRSLYTL